MVLCASATRDGYTIMGQEKLGVLCGASQAWVGKYMKVLTGKDLIHISKRATNGLHMMNEYHLILDNRVKKTLPTKTEVDQVVGHLVVRSPQYLVEEAVLPLTYKSPDVHQT
jgi:hypothetical protein